ncbi:MAG: hypothetical protein U0797_30305 [Gemmataceae bacterium]
MGKGRVTYTLTIVDAGGPGDGDAVRRLRALLKRAWRSYRFRCVRISEHHPDDDPDGNPTRPASRRPARSPRGYYLVTATCNALRSHHDD